MKALGVLTVDEDLARLRKLNLASDHSSSVQALRSAGNAKPARGLMSKVGGRQSIVVGLLSAEVNDAAEISALIGGPARLSRLILAIAVDNGLDPG